MAFDAVAGELTGRVLGALPPDSKVTVFGALSFEAARATPDQLIFQKKSVDGFWLGPFIASKNLLEIMLMWRRAQRLQATELKSDLREKHPLDDAPRAVEQYSSRMTGGKHLLVTKHLDA